MYEWMNMKIKIYILKASELLYKLYKIYLKIHYLLFSSLNTEEPATFHSIYMVFDVTIDKYGCGPLGIAVCFYNFLRALCVKSMCGTAVLTHSQQHLD